MRTAAPVVLGRVRVASLALSPGRLRRLSPASLRERGRAVRAGDVPRTEKLGIVRAETVPGASEISCAGRTKSRNVRSVNDDEQHDDDDSGDDNPGQPQGLEGVLQGAGLPIGDPFAMATDCSLLQPDPKRKIEGCVACIQCDACGQLFRINLLGKALHACPKCKLEYTSVLIVAVTDDDQILRDAFRTVLRSNGIALGADDDDGDEYDDDDGGELGDDDQADDDQANR
jgi:hypothetical protein